MSKTRILTGITTTGTPHLGNFAGAIGPAIEATRRNPEAEFFFFLADYHALIKCQVPERVQRSRLEVAATWLALGLDPERVCFYRQSDIPEIPELTWLLTCVTAKGLMNRAHAYKAAVQENLDSGDADPDKGVTMGLFSYPILMAADILMFNARKVPVGKDQTQHLEMARDIAQRFNHIYGEHFVLPEAVVEDDAAVLAGLDGRKMSKSYNNTIPLFVSAKELRKLVMRIVTNSQLPGEPKDPDGSTLFQIYQAFASADETAAIRVRYAEGIAWGEMKQVLFEKLDSVLAGPREHYAALISDPAALERILLAGADKARAIASPFLAGLRAATGLRKLG